MPAAVIQLLQIDIESRGEFADQTVSPDKLVELVSVNGQVQLSCELPGVFLIDGDSDKVGLDVRKPIIVVSLDPDNIDSPPRIGQLPDIGKKVPVFFRQTPEIEVAEDIAEQDQPLEAQRPQQLERLARSRGFRTKV